VSVPRVGDLKEAGDVQGLIEMLLDEKMWRTRPEVAAALADLGDPRAVEPLSRILNDPPGKTAKFTIRQACAEALAKIGGADAAAALKHAVIHDTDSRVRRVCLRGLGGDLADAEVFAAIVARLNDKDRMERARAAAALARMESPEGLEAVLDAIRSGVDVPLHASRGRGYLDFLLGLGDAGWLKAVMDEHMRPGDEVAFVLVGLTLANMVIGLQDRLIAIGEPTRGPRDPLFGAHLWVGRVPVKVMPYAEMTADSIQWHPTGKYVTLGHWLKGVRYEFISHVDMLDAEHWKYYLEQIPVGG
jgi:hypothetical protein